jgi:hypothetical protein
VNESSFDFDKDCFPSGLRFILKSHLTESPHWFICFRELTLVLACRAPAGSEVLVETSRDIRDFVWQWLRRQGGMDYVRDLVFEDDRLAGVVIDTSFDLKRSTLIISPLIPDFMPRNRTSLLTYLNR